MLTPDFTNLNLDKLITHHIGSPALEEGIHLSEVSTKIEPTTHDYLLKYFLAAFKTEEFYQFNHTIDLNMNEVCAIAGSLFDDPDGFIEGSKQLARLLYEHSSHPKIKPGELNVALFSDAVLDGEVVDALGIFKSENSVPFIRMDGEADKYTIRHDFGFELRGIDKGCFIFNTERNNGYRILVVDNTNRSAEAVYWKDDFLQVAPVSDEFYHTRQFMGMTHNYVANRMQEEFEVTKADKIDLLNRSVEYFKNNGNFDKTQFENEVLQQDEIIDSFRNFNDSWASENQLDIPQSFEISPQAVKKQSRVFKSVLKLDKNFHIYIHGDRELIERGTDPDGRKFYKIFYNQET
jgi:hypothetical protein